MAVPVLRLQSLVEEDEATQKPVPSSRGVGVKPSFRNFKGLRVLELERSHRSWMVWGLKLRGVGGSKGVGARAQVLVGGLGEK